MFVISHYRISERKEYVIKCKYGYHMLLFHKKVFNTESLTEK